MFYPLGKTSEKPYGGGHPPPPPLYVRVKILFQHISIFLVFSCIRDSDSLSQPFTSFSQPSDREIIWVADNDDDKGWCDCTQAVFFFGTQSYPAILSVGRVTTHNKYAVAYIGDSLYSSPSGF